jgi:hypothetical protein
MEGNGVHVEGGVHDELEHVCSVGGAALPPLTSVDDELVQRTILW